MIPTSRISQFLKDRPPAASEYRPLNGLDPTVHAEVTLLANCFWFTFILNIAYFVNSSTMFQLALKDAEKLMDLCGKSVKPYILKANALILVRISNCLKPPKKDLHNFQTKTIVGKFLIDISIFLWIGGAICFFWNIMEILTTCRECQSWWGINRQIIIKRE